MGRRRLNDRGNRRSPTEGDLAENMSAWASFRDLTGHKMPVRTIVRQVRSWHRKKTSIRLATMAVELTNRGAGVQSAEIQQLAYSVLLEPVEGDSEFEHALARALTQQSTRPALLHEQALLILQQLVLSESPDDGDEPNFRQLVFWLFCLSDHVWSTQMKENTLREMVGAIAFYSVFNQTSEDSLEFLCRTNGIFSLHVANSPVSAVEWEQLQREAFGAPVAEYIRLFVAPLLVFNEGFGFQQQPTHGFDTWCLGPGGSRMKEWFSQASLSLEDWRGRLELPELVNEIPPLQKDFLHHPMVESDEGVLILAPNLLRAHFLKGIWGRLNGAAKRIDSKDGGGRFRTEMGYRFELWAQQLARSAQVAKEYRDRLILPSDDVAIEGISDVVFVCGNRVVLIEAKLMLQPDNRLRLARNAHQFVDWLDPLLFAPKTSKNRKGGAFVQLDNVIIRIREGAYEALGIKRGLLIAPVLLTLDPLPASAWFYKWVDKRCEEEGLLHARKNVRPVTSIGAADFEKMFLFTRGNGGVTKLLFAKVSSGQRARAFDQFLGDRRVVRQPKRWRLTFIEDQFEELQKAAREGLKALMGVPEGAES